MSETKPNFQIFTVFTEGGGKFNNVSIWKGCSLDELIQHAYEFFGKQYAPIAWAAEGTRSYYGTKTFSELLDESLAAGRTIEKVGDKWIARGVAGEEPKPAEKSLVEQLRDLVAVQGTDGTWNADEYMCGMFNGMELALSMAEGRDPQFRTLKPAQQDTPKSTALPALSSLCISPDQKSQSHLVEPVFGSAELIRR